nr:LacI family DNA-binding transcriptional regulator [Kribbella qitaiheensis]
MATLKQVAAHAEVSVQTVSNALNAPHRLRPRHAAAGHQVDRTAQLPPQS